jgi:hypothetical protein
MIDEGDVRKAFDTAGFRNTHDLKRTSEFESRANDIVYVNKDRLQNNCICVYVEETLHVPAMTGLRPIGRRFSSNLRQFPSRLHNGKTPCHYGLAIVVDSLSCLDNFLNSVFRR